MALSGDAAVRAVAPSGGRFELNLAAGRFELTAGFARTR